MKITNEISVSNTSGNRNNPIDAVRVYRNGVLIAEVNPPSRDPLNYIRKHSGKYRKELFEQLLAANVEPYVIDMIIQ